MCDTSNWTKKYLITRINQDIILLSLCKSISEVAVLDVAQILKPLATASDD